MQASSSRAVERLRQVIVGAGVQALDPVFQLALLAVSIKIGVAQRSARTWRARS